MRFLCAFLANEKLEKEFLVMPLCGEKREEVRGSDA
jgi:hypothetical protein